MITNTFCHMPHIGSKTEEHLWSSGIHTWHDLSRATESGMFKAAGRDVASGIEQSISHLDQGHPSYFANRLPPHQAWRLYDEFKDSAAFFDIETTGLAPPRDAITTIALYDGRTVRYYVNGLNLDKFPEDIAAYKLLVTYNGSQFDIPFSERFFNIRLPQVQIDLRFVLHKLGFTGGLKGCERALGINRGELDGVNGYFAVVLWREFIQRGNPLALETLVAYNIADTVNLERLMCMAYNLNLEQTPFSASRTLPMPAAPELPFAPDVDTVRRLKRQYARFLDK